MKKQFHEVTAVYDGLFNTASGAQVSLYDPTPEMITIEDIAGALSKICRFGGHSRMFYSVAQHCVLVARIAPEEIAFEALMHDASEAYLGDVIKPLKVILGKNYAELEERFMNVISKRFGLDKYKLEAVKVFDREMLVIEHQYLQMGYEDQWQITCLNAGYNGALWEHHTAERTFLHVFNQLASARTNIVQS